MRKIFVLGALAAAAAAGAHAAGDPIPIASTMELSGPAADVSRAALEGALFAVDTINKNGGVLGRPVALKYQDNGTNPQKAVTQASAMLQEGAKFLMTNASSSSIAVSKTVTAKQKIPTCGSTTQTDDLTIKEFNPYIYGISANSYMIMHSVAAYLAKQPYKRYALVGADFLGGHSGINRFKEFMKELKPDVEFVTEEYPKFGATDYTPTINKVLASKPDYVFTMLFGNDLITFSKQAQAIGFFKQINNRFAGLYDGDTLTAMGAAAPVGTDGFQAAAMNAMAKSSADGKAFVDAFKQKVGHYPSDWATLAYDCISVWAQAANAAKSTDPDKVMAAIETQTFKSPRGPYRFGKFDHQAEAPTYIGKVAQSSEYGQPVLELSEVIPGTASRPSEQTVLKMRSGG
jgi:branched-chain amino acid transport system substrate-binding protein